MRIDPSSRLENINRFNLRPYLVARCPHFVPPGSSGLVVWLGRSHGFDQASAGLQDTTTLAFRGATPYPVVDPAVECIVEARVFRWARCADLLGDLNSNTIAGEKHRWGVVVAVTFGHPIVLHDLYVANKGQLVPRIRKNFRNIFRTAKNPSLMSSFWVE